LSSHNEERPIIQQPGVQDALSWHWNGHSGGYWQQVELPTMWCKPNNDADDVRRWWLMKLCEWYGGRNDFVE